MMRCVSKGSAGDARRLRETGSRLRAMMKVKDELIADQKELIDLQAAQLADVGKMIDVQAQRLTNRDQLIDVQGQQIAALEELVARDVERVGRDRAPDGSE
jgi:hypothetical protein